MNIDIDIDNKIPSDDSCQQTAREGEQAPRRPTTPRTPDHFEDRARTSFRTSLNAREQQANCREKPNPFMYENAKRYFTSKLCYAMLKSRVLPVLNTMTVGVDSNVKY